MNGIDFSSIFFLYFFSHDPLYRPRAAAASVRPRVSPYGWTSFSSQILMALKMASPFHGAGDTPPTLQIALSRMVF